MRNNVFVYIGLDISPNATKKIAVEILFQHKHTHTQIQSTHSQLSQSCQYRFRCLWKSTEPNRIVKTQNGIIEMCACVCACSSTQRQRRQRYVIIRMRIAAWTMSHTQTFRTTVLNRLSYSYARVAAFDFPNHAKHKRLCMCALCCWGTHNLRASKQASERVKWLCMCECLCGRMVWWYT